MEMVGILVIMAVVTTMAALAILPRRSDVLSPRAISSAIAEDIVLADRQVDVLSGRVRFIARHGSVLAADVVEYRRMAQGGALEYRLRRAGHRRAQLFWRGAAAISV